MMGPAVALVGGLLLLLTGRRRSSSNDNGEAFSSPLANPIVTSGWGASRAYRATADNPHPTHEGLDFRAAIGTPVYAMADGVVLLTDNRTDTIAGPFVRVQHSGGRVSESLHLSKLGVKRGDRVRRGQLLGLSGEARDVPHLHLTVRLDAAALARYRARYGMPKGGFGHKNNGGTAVPAEPLVPASYAAAVITASAARGVAAARQLAA